MKETIIALISDALKKMEKDGELTEDELKKAQDEVQKITDKFIKEVDQVATAKEKDIMLDNVIVSLIERMYI